MPVFAEHIPSHTEPEPEPEPEPASQGWEEPTTVQAPTWDDEPSRQSSESWPQVPEPIASEENQVQAEEVSVPGLQPEPVPERVLSALPAQLQPSTAKVENVQALAPAKPATPAAHTRPTSAAHRHKFKTDQAVIMPSGSFGTPLEKVGMQFGSLNLGGDDLEASS